MSTYPSNLVRDWTSKDPYPDGKSCEFAIVVDDEWQNHGIGYQIMLDLIRIAKERGFKTMKGLILSANREMVQLATDLGFKVDPVPGDAKVVGAIKDLNTDFSV